MKTLIKTIIVLFSLISFFAYAGSGKAILAHWTALENANRPSLLYISNITDNTVEVTVTFFGKDGSKLSPSTTTNFISGGTQLAAKTTGFITIEQSSFNYGFAIIEWQNLQGDDDAVALVAHGIRVTTDTSYKRSDISIQVNDGHPF